MENEFGLEETLNPQDDEDISTPQDEEETEEKSEEKPQGKEEKDYKSLYENQRIRAEKVEKELKEFKSKGEDKDGLSQKDLLFLAKADVHEDDLDEILDYAKFKKVEVKDALGSGFIKSYLADQKEKRKTSEVTSTGSKRSGVKGKDGSEMLKDAESGIFPGTDDIEALVEARFQSKANKSGGR
jgi:hypothetical protein